MRRYETIFILRPDLGEAVQQENIKRFEAMIGQSGGELIETDEWGSRELAYHIKGERRGYYVRLDYGGDGPTMNEIERNLKLADSVLRYLSVLVAPEVDPIAARAEVDARNRRVAEARAAAEAKAAAAAAERAEAQAQAAEAAAAESGPKEENVTEGTDNSESAEELSEPEGEQ